MQRSATSYTLSKKCDAMMGSTHEWMGSTMGSTMNMFRVFLRKKARLQNAFLFILK